MSIRLLGLIGLGGAIGALARYSVSLLTFSEVFPYATLIVNLIGCFVLAYVANSPEIKRIIPAHILTAISTGLIGSFTTFSTVSVETIALWNSTYYLAIIYLFLNLFGGLLLCVVGYKLAIRKVESI